MARHNVRHSSPYIAEAVAIGAVPSRVSIHFAVLRSNLVELYMQMML
jgi:hypothetical protein